MFRHKDSELLFKVITGEGGVNGGWGKGRELRPEGGGA